MKTVLVTGGAGYIGSHMAAALHRQGYKVIVADNLCTGHKEAVKFGELCVGDVRETSFLDSIFTTHHIDGIIHFAASSLVGESCLDPLKYYMNNLAGAQMLLEAMRRHGIKNIVFSSTAAVYGEPRKQPIEENDITLPTNPYGESKLAVERLLKWCDKAYGIRYVCLRYFNAAGADNLTGIGEDHSPETHLIPLVLQTALGKSQHIRIFGNDYPTPDGTCLRDYIDVRDLTDAHILALEHLDADRPSDVFNLGSSTGYSVRQIIDMAQKVTGCMIPSVVAERRAGDPPVLIASNKKAKQRLGWQPRYSLEDMVLSAWHWHKSYPFGFGEI